jgi:hypothetical protein
MGLNQSDGGKSHSFPGSTAPFHSNGDWPVCSITMDEVDNVDEDD